MRDRYLCDINLSAILDMTMVARTPDLATISCRGEMHIHCSVMKNLPAMALFACKFPRLLVEHAKLSTKTCPLLSERCENGNRTLLPSK